MHRLLRRPSELKEDGRSWYRLVWLKLTVNNRGWERNLTTYELARKKYNLLDLHRDGIGVVHYVWIRLAGLHLYLADDFTG